MAGKDDDIVAVLYHRDRAKHPNDQLLSEGSQDQLFGSLQEFSGYDAVRHQVTQHSGLAASNNVVSTGEQSTKCSGAARIKDPPWANHTTAVTFDYTSLGCSTANTLAGPNLSTKDHDHRHRPTLALSNILHQASNCWISQHT